MSVQRWSLPTELQGDQFGDYVAHDDFLILQKEFKEQGIALSEALDTIMELRKDIADLRKMMDGLDEEVKKRVVF